MTTLYHGTITTSFNYDLTFTDNPYLHRYDPSTKYASAESNVSTKLNRLLIDVSYIVMITISCSKYEEEKSSRDGQCDDPKDSNLASLHDEPDSLV